MYGVFLSVKVCLNLRNTVQTLMKCSMMLNFILVYTVSRIQQINHVYLFIALDMVHIFIGKLMKAVDLWLFTIVSQIDWFY